MTPVQIGQQLGAAYVLGGSLRRAGNRLRINTQLIDTVTDFPIWSERYDREMKDVFEVQDEIASKIAQALRITLSPQEQEALASKPTDNFRLTTFTCGARAMHGACSARTWNLRCRCLRMRLVLDPNFALAYAALANVCAQNYYLHGRDTVWIERAMRASGTAVVLRPDLPEVQIAQAWILYANGKYDKLWQLSGKRSSANAIAREGTISWAALCFPPDATKQVADIADAAVEAGGDDYNVYVPIINALGALGKEEALRNWRHRAIAALEQHLRQVPEDARARILLAGFFAAQDRLEDAVREANFAIALRPNEASVLYNAACTFCLMKKKPEAMEALRKAWKRAGPTRTGCGTIPTSLRCMTILSSIDSILRARCLSGIEGLAVQAYALRAFPALELLHASGDGVVKGWTHAADGVAGAVGPCAVGEQDDGEAAHRVDP